MKPIKKMKLINGWTKATVMAQIKKYNNNTKAMCLKEKCVYQTENGNRCAVGCFIPDGHAALKADGAASDLVERYPDLLPLMPFEPLFLNYFQVAHDSADRADRETKVYDSIQEFLDTKVE